MAIRIQPGQRSALQPSTLSFNSVFWVCSAIKFVQGHRPIPDDRFVERHTHELPFIPLFDWLDT